MRKISIYCDGGCQVSVRKGGWAVVIVDSEKDEVLETISDRKDDTTNNEMELAALLIALRRARKMIEAEPTEVEIWADSQYCVNGYNSWCHSWEKNRWRNSSKREVLNLGLWQKIHLIRDKNISLQWVKAHNGHKYNELCDSLTRD